VKAVRFAGLPDPGRAHCLDELVGCLRQLKLWAGDPSYETVTRRINARWRADTRPVDELARRGTVVDCFKTGRRRINIDLVIAVVQALHDETGYVTQWRQALRVSLAEITAAAQVRVLDRLPDDVATFTGRTSEMVRIGALGARPGLRPPVCVLTGMAGVGKTQLAVHAGHLQVAAGGFDTTLFVNLRGFHADPGQPPAEPAAVLDGFLRVLGLSGHEIPHGLEARTAAFREQLAGRRTLIILDNAAAEEQVRPLIRLVSGALTLITSRRGLTGLNPELHVEIGPFTADEAEQLLARSAPEVAIGPDRAAHRRVARRCGYLPLALSVVAGQMAARPGWTVTDHADRLDERHRRLRLDTGMELALHLSYKHLPEQRQILLRRMAAHPGPDLDSHAGAALLGTDPDTAATELRQLAAEHLVQEPVAGRYALHDLVRAYASERSLDEDRPADQRNALSRLFDHYVRSATTAMDALYPGERRHPSARPPHRPQLDDPQNALLWLDAERAALVAACLYAARNGWPEYTVRLADTLYTYLDNGCHPADALAVHADAHYAAQLLGDRIAEATALTNLGVVCWQLDRHPEAIEHFERALSLSREAGDGRGEARILANLGVAYATTGRAEISAPNQHQALDRFVPRDDRVVKARTR
jgi:tetratricopeptide (TPR) repeat protein